MREAKYQAWDNVKNRMYSVGEESNIHFELTSGGIIAYDLNEEQDSPDYKMDHLKYRQFIGLKDDNDVEAYEGDVVKDYDGKLYEVIWDDFCFNLKGFYSSYYDYPTLAFSESICFEVIGNIYENPELLEEDAE